MGWMYFKYLVYAKWKLQIQFSFTCGTLLWLLFYCYYFYEWVHNYN